MQQTVTRFRNSNPQVDVDFSEVAVDDIFQRLLEGSLDLAFVISPANHPQAVHVECVWEDNLVVAVQSGSALAQNPMIDPAQLRRARFALPREDFGMFEVANRGEFHPIIDSKCDTLEEALTQVSLCGRVVVLPRLLSKYMTFPGIAYRVLAGRPIVKQTLMAYRCEERSGSVEAFVQEALACVGAAGRCVL